jgi:hypothetical protein
MIVIIMTLKTREEGKGKSQFLEKRFLHVNKQIMNLKYAFSKNILHLSTASSSSHGMFVAPMMSSLSSLEVVAPSI